jgi:DNA invertase Pin-like site-specific DNA recombinase
MSDYTMSDVQEADELWDKMPLKDVSKLTGIPMGTLGGWSSSGLISTEEDWLSKNGGPDKKVNPRRAVQAVFEKGMSYAEAGERLGVSSSTINKYIQDYRNGDL